MPSNESRRAVAPGQVWRGAYSIQYHVLARVEDWAWIKIFYPAVSAGGQPDQPRTEPVSFFERMELLYAADQRQAVTS